MSKQSWRCSVCNIRAIFIYIGRDTNEGSGYKSVKQINQLLALMRRCYGTTI